MRGHGLNFHTYRETRKVEFRVGVEEGRMYMFPNGVIGVDRWLRDMA